jgi:hypothetical protein
MNPFTCKLIKRHNVLHYHVRARIGLQSSRWLRLQRSSDCRYMKVVKSALHTVRFCPNPAPAPAKDEPVYLFVLEAERFVQFSRILLGLYWRINISVERLTLAKQLQGKESFLRGWCFSIWSRNSSVLWNLNVLLPTLSVTNPVHFYHPICSILIL